MSEYISDNLLAKIALYDPIAENAKRHQDDFDGFHCVKCHQMMSVESEYDPTPLCYGCQYEVLMAVVKEVIARRSDASRRAQSVIEQPRQRNVRFHGLKRGK